MQTGRQPHTSSHNCHPGGKYSSWSICECEPYCISLSFRTLLGGAHVYKPHSLRPRPDGAAAHGPQLPAERKRLLKRRAPTGRPRLLQTGTHTALQCN